MNNIGIIKDISTLYKKQKSVDDWCCGTYSENKLCMFEQILYKLKDVEINEDKLEYYRRKIQRKIQQKLNTNPDSFCFDNTIKILFLLNIDYNNATKFVSVNRSTAGCNFCCRFNNKAEALIRSLLKYNKLEME